MATKNAKSTEKKSSHQGDGRLKIGDQWNAIRIIALSQSNPLKAIAEFVENSIDASAKNISIIRGKQRGEQYLRIIDDGEGVHDFAYVATHIGDSIKRRLKERGANNVQGEFGIGLLSFWTVGEELALTSMAEDGVVRRLTLVKESPAYSIRESRTLFNQPGSMLHISPLLPGVRVLSGEKIQTYLASELRDRISKSGIKITIVDRKARKELLVEPRTFRGHFIQDLPALRSPLGEIAAEIYITEPALSAGVGVYKNGTRIVSDISTMEDLKRPPWNSGYLEGVLDCGFLQLTPGTRGGVIYDHAFAAFASAVESVESLLIERIDAQKRAEDEKASRSILKKITKALREAFSMLPDESYGWLAAQSRRSRSGGDHLSSGSGNGGSDQVSEMAASEEEQVPGTILEQPDTSGGQREFFDVAGPLYRVDIRPASAMVEIGKSRNLRAVARDKSRREIESNVSFRWRVEQGAGDLDRMDGEYVEYRAPAEPELAKITVVAVQEEVEVEAESLITVTADLIPEPGEHPSGAGRGLPGYTYAYAPGELWRSIYEIEKTLITVNSGHPDFVHASKQRAAKLRYIARLFAKEIIISNFPGESKEQLLERMIELELYMEENLR